MKPRPDKDPDLTAMGIREIKRGLASIEETRARTDMPQWTVNVNPPADLSPVQIGELTRAVQRALLEQAKRNRRWPGSAA